MQKFLENLHKMRIAMELQASLFGEQRWESLVEQFFVGDSMLPVILQAQIQ